MLYDELLQHPQIFSLLLKCNTSEPDKHKFSTNVMFLFWKVLKIFCCNLLELDVGSSFFFFLCIYRRVYHIRRNKAATIIQRHIRGWLKRTQFGRIKLCVLGLQARARGLLARRRYQQMRYNHKVCLMWHFIFSWNDSDYAKTTEWSFKCMMNVWYRGDLNTR
jgi:hypothetical protein